MEGLTVADVLFIAENALGIDAERLKRVADIGAVESALAAPFAGWSDQDLYPDPARKAAVLCSRLLRNHPLPDGNKRVAFVCMRTFLDMNGLLWNAPSPAEAAHMVESLAAREVSEEDFTAWVASRLA